jgi:hypothetical protein
MLPILATGKMCPLWTILLIFAKGNIGEAGESAAVCAGTTMASTISHIMAFCRGNEND